VNEIPIQLTQLQKAASLLCCAGYLATLACPAMRPLMLQLRRLFFTETSLLIQLLAVMFAPSSVALLCRGKTNGLTQGNKLRVVKPPVQMWRPPFSAVRRDKVVHNGYGSATRA
jgi:hypothetical protein